jgi:AcrR family transcriptional regulator
MDRAQRRTGPETRAEAERIALSLFSSKGYEATSLREIAEGLGITKAALYYHFPSKESIVLAGLESRGAEAAELLSWARAQEPHPGLLRQTVLRWVDSMSIDKLRGIRFMTVNAAALRSIGGTAGRQIGDNLAAVVTLVAGQGADAVRLLLVRMALLSINTAVSAAQGTAASDEQIVASARQLALAILDQLERVDASAS